MELYNAAEVAAIKIAAGNMEGLGLATRDILLSSITWLKENYEKSHNCVYLHKAVWHIYAYLELGFPYSGGEQEFQCILAYLQKSREHVFPKERWLYKGIALNKMNIHKLLGRWNPVLHSMKIADVVADIIKNVSENQEGEYLYYCGKPVAEDAKGTLWEHTFRLYVHQREAIFHDVYQNRYYVFV